MLLRVSLAVLLAAVGATAECVTATFAGGNGMAQFNQLIAKYKTNSLTTTSGDYTYALRFCPEEANGEMMTATKTGGKKIVLARRPKSSDVTVAFEGSASKIMKIKLTGGDVMGACNDSKKKTEPATTILVTCNPGAKGKDTLVFGGAPVDITSQNVFVIQTDIVCDKVDAAIATTTAAPAMATTATLVKAASSVSAHTASGTFLTILCMMLVAYFFCVFLYRRFVMGAQGVEQIPHFFLFRRIITVFQAKAEGIRRGSFVAEGPGSYQPTGDGREFHYATPPLTEDRGYSSLPPGDVQRPARTAEPSDADERLLPV